MKRHQDILERPLAQRGWDDGYDPTMEFYDHSNIYTRGPGAYLAAEHQPYNIQPGAQPYKLYISGVHPQTSENGLLNIFQQYGNPISVYKTKNTLQDSIAFVEFASQREADSAIINLDRKPPLYWSVTYATSKKERYDPMSDFNEVILGEVERQTPLHLQSYAAIERQTAAPAYPGPVPGGSSSTVLRREENLSPYPSCSVCATAADLVCTVCETRYCSKSCQSGDWPTHRYNCIPQSVLQLAQPAVNNVVPSTATVTELTAPIRGTTANPNRSGIQALREWNAEALVNPQPSVMQGIRTMTINDRPSPYDITRTIPNAVSGNAPPSTIATLLSPNFYPNVTSPRDQFPIVQSQQENCNDGRNARPPARNFPIQRMSPPGSGGRNNQMLNYRLNNVVEPPRQMKIYAQSYQNAKLTTPPPNVSALVHVCFIKSPSDFHIQFKRYANELEELMDSIQDSAKDASPLPSTPAELSPCLAIFPEDRKWYRAQVVKLFDDGIGVIFVDFGNTMKLINTRENLRQMEEKFSKAPGYAVRAKLADVVPVNGVNAWPLSIKAKFKQLVELNDFTMDRVRDEEDGTMCVRLRNDKGTDIAQLLISNGAAKSVSATTSQPSHKLDPVPPLEIKYRRPLESGFRGNVVVRVVEGVDRIFAQVHDYESCTALAKVTELLNILFPKTKAPETAPAVGSYVAAIFNKVGGPVFYRARVTAVEGNQLTLEYIDYGNTGKVELAHIRNLSKELCDIPCTTYRLSLNLRRRPDGVFCDAIETQLNSLIGKICTIEVLESTNGLIECTLTKDGQVINKSISDLLDNTLGIFYYQAGPFVKLPPCGIDFKALILNVDNPPLMKICPFDDIEMLNKLFQLNMGITTYVDSLGTLPVNSYYEPKVYEMFLAQSPLDGFWYRSCCVKILPFKETQFECLQVDYGKTMTVSMDKILPIPKRFITFMPYMSLPVVMKEFAPTFEVTYSVGARLRELLPEAKLVEDISIVSSDDDKFWVNIPSVSSTLIAEGLI